MFKGSGRFLLYCVSSDQKSMKVRIFSSGAMLVLNSVVRVCVLGSCVARFACCLVIGGNGVFRGAFMVIFDQVLMAKELV